MSPPLPRYPIYVVSKGRAYRPLTIRMLQRDGVPFRVVVEPQEAEQYASVAGPENVLVLPFSKLRLGSIPARNWIKAHATTAGAERHWCLDDNIYRVRRLWHRRRVPWGSNVALRVCEDFVDRYENVGVAGLAYTKFVIPNRPPPPFYANVHVYSCMLISNALPLWWRGRYNEDTDLCLQALANGWCTLLVQSFMVDKVTTMTMKGGNTDELYQGDGRLKMARVLEKAWPGVARVEHRYGRPQHVVDWTRFTGCPTLQRKRHASSAGASATAEIG